MDKLCSKCKQTKDESLFATAYWCKGCRSEYGKLHYAANKKRYRESNVRAKERLTDKVRQLVWDILGEKCQRCGYGVSKQALHCHHKNPASKLFSLSDRYTSNTEKLVEEINKCVLICANCHAELHEGLWSINVDLSKETSKE